MAKDFTNTIICGEAKEVMSQWPDEVVDTIITDPPYGLEFMGKDWDKFDISAGRAKRLKRAEKPQDAQKYDYLQGKGRYSEMTVKEKSAMQEFFYQWAIEVLRIAKPGAIMLIFGGTRTFHRLTCAIEDAGWVIRDCMMWIYGSGFPKSLDISKAIDKTKGVERKKIGQNPHHRILKPTNTMCGEPHSGDGSITAPATALARLWDGYGTALKPAWEPIVVAMKPLDGTFAHNAEKWGVAGLNIDGGKVGTDTHIVHGKEAGKFQPCGGETKKDYHEVQGRWPANLILDEEAAAMLDEMSGNLQSGKLLTHHKREGKGLCGSQTFAIRNRTGESCNFGGDSGGASRFFYCAKASRAERNAGLEGLEEKRPDNRSDIAKGIWTEKGTAKQTNHHPTVKPIKLMEYLCRLTRTPTGGVVLDCFGGSGTTAMACVNTDRDYVLIEKEEDYCEIARKRVAWAKEQKAGQMGLFEQGS